MKASSFDAPSPYATSIAGRPVLVVESDPDQRRRVTTQLAGWGYTPLAAGTAEEALELLSRAGRVAFSVVAIRLPGMSGIDLLRRAGELAASGPVIMVADNGHSTQIVEAIQAGADDFLRRPYTAEDLEQVIRGVAGRPRREPATPALAAGEDNGDRVQRELAMLTSVQMREILSVIEQAARADVTVLVCGETGVGKELVARAIHAHSPRRRAAFVKVNCAAMPRELLESELFGHERGAFTGAHQRKPGRFELADGGTIFLDEIAEMSSNLQAKYLRVLQDSQVRRVGGHDEIGVDVRVVAATNKDVVKAVQEGVFREDLYYRVNVLTIPLPPLRRRPEDIPLLADAFIAEFNEKYSRQVRGVDGAALKLLNEHNWPGNVRELRNVIERAVVSCEEGLITPECLPLSPLGTPPVERANVVVLPLGTTLDDGERALILRTLQSVNNNKTRAAEILGTTPKTLHNKARRWRELQLDRQPEKRA